MRKMESRIFIFLYIVRIVRISAVYIYTSESAPFVFLSFAISLCSQGSLRRQFSFNFDGRNTARRGSFKIIIGRLSLAALEGTFKAFSARRLSNERRVAKVAALIRAVVKCSSKWKASPRVLAVVVVVVALSLSFRSMYSDKICLTLLRDYQVGSERERLLYTMSLPPGCQHLAVLTTTPFPFQAIPPPPLPPSTSSNLLLLSFWKSLRRLRIRIYVRAHLAPIKVSDKCDKLALLYARLRRLTFASLFNIRERASMLAVHEERHVRPSRSSSKIFTITEYNATGLFFSLLEPAERLLSLYI